MKICIFTENHLKGGVDTFLSNLINAWPEEHDKFTVVCNAGHPGLDTIFKKVKRDFKLKKYYRFYISIFAAGQDKWGIGKLFPVRAFYVLSYRLLQYFFLFPWYVLSLSIYFRKNDFDRLIVVNGGYPASLICRGALVGWRFADKSSLGILNFHSSPPKKPSGIKFLENRIDLLVAKSTSSIITVSEDCMQSLVARPKLEAQKNRYVIPNGIEDPLINALKFPVLKKRASKSCNYLLMIGSYEPRKGHLYLLKAFNIVIKSFPELKLKIYGYGSIEQKLIIRNEIERLGLANSVEINDFADDVIPLILNSEMVVVPSQEYESFNFTIIEAMSCATPVVVTDVGGMPEVIGTSNAGFICRKNDHEDFAHAILRILENENLRKEMALSGRSFYETQYTSKLMAVKYRKLIV